MERLLDTIDIWACKLVIWFLKRGYGANCETWDYEDDYGDNAKHPTEVNAGGRCASCCAKEVIIWLENHISLIKQFEKW